MWCANAQTVRCAELGPGPDLPWAIWAIWHRAQRSSTCKGAPGSLKGPKRNKIQMNSNFFFAPGGNNVKNFRHRWLKCLKFSPPDVKISKILAFSRETSKKFRLHRNAGPPQLLSPDLAGAYFTKNRKHISVGRKHIFVTRRTLRARSPRKLNRLS